MTQLTQPATSNRGRFEWAGQRPVHPLCSAFRCPDHNHLAEMRFIGHLSGKATQPLLRQLLLTIALRR
jgi:hypothetical protein